MPHDLPPTAMSDQCDCHVTLLTPPGRSAVAVLLVDGQEAQRQVDQIFRAASGGLLGDAPPGRIHFGYVGRGQNSPGEQVVVYPRGPRAVEIHCHGGSAAAAMIIDLLVGLGCEPARWENRVEDFETDFLAAEARTALARARTERVAAILLDQYNGAFRRELASIAARIESRETDEAAAALHEFVDRSKTGLHLADPWRVVVAGRPNVGKSSLINALLGFQRAIVYEQPGTTRDAVTTLTAIDGWPVELIDTAGLRTSDDEIERAGIQVARERIDKADLVVFVGDVAQEWTAEDDQLFRSLPSPLLVHNKSDLPRAAGRRPPGLATSAVTGDGIDRLIAAATARLVPQPPPPGTAVPFTPRQVTVLRQALAKLDQGDAQAAAALLSGPPTGG